STLPKRTSGNCRAAAAKCGAIWRHGPHQAAQKSTNTGASVARTYFAKTASETSTGTGSASAVLHLAHTGSSPSRSSGTRLVVAQWGQTSSMTVPSFAADALGRANAMPAWRQRSADRFGSELVAAPSDCADEL